MPQHLHILSTGLCMDREESICILYPWLRKNVFRVSQAPIGRGARVACQKWPTGREHC